LVLIGGSTVRTIKYINTDYEGLITFYERPEMPAISLTDLVDIVSKTGTSKATKVAQIKARPEYAPALDFYKPLRDKLVATHKAGETKSSLTSFVTSISDAKKKANYPIAIDGYRKWWGKKQFTWADPPRKNYASGGIQVSVNPELRLKHENTEYIVKLYLKDEKLTRTRVDLITALLEISFREHISPNVQLGLLDVRHSKLHLFSGALAPVHAMIDAELAYVAKLWDSV
jgi:hypothetical protein